MKQEVDSIGLAVDEDLKSSGSGSIARGGTILLVVFVLSAVFKYGFHFALGWLLPPDEYGMFGVGEAYIMILSTFIIASFPWVVTKYISDGRYGAIKPSLLGNFLLAVIICAVFYAAYISGIIRLGEGYGIIVDAVIFTILATSIGNVYIGGLQGSFRFARIGITRSLGIFLTVAVGIVLVLAGFGSSGAIVGYILGGVVLVAFGIYYTRDLEPLSGSCIDRNVYLMALPLFVGIFGINFISNIDILGVKTFSPAEISDMFSGYYKAALVWAKLPTYIVIALAGLFFPLLSRYAKDSQKIRSYTTVLLKYAVVFLLPFTIIFAVIPKEVIGIIYPPDYTQAGMSLSILAVAMFAIVMLYILATVFQAVGRPKFPAIVLGLLIPFQIVLLYVLVPKYEMNGAASATAVCAVLGLLALVVAYIVNYRPGNIVIPFVKTIIVSAVLIVFLMLFPVQGRILTCLSMVIGYIIYVMLSVIVGLLKPDDVDNILGGMLHEESALRRGIIGAMRKLALFPR